MMTPNSIAETPPSETQLAPPLVATEGGCVGHTKPTGDEVRLGSPVGIGSAGEAVTVAVGIRVGAPVGAAVAPGSVGAGLLVGALVGA